MSIKHFSNVVAVAVAALVAAACGSDSDTNGSGSSGSTQCAVALADDPVVGKVLCLCPGVAGPGSPGKPRTEAIDACTPTSLGRPALCYDHPDQNVCDCRAYICQTRVSDGRCSCGVGAYAPSVGNTDGCTSTKGVCCLEGTSCFCGLDKCGTGRTPVSSCDASIVLDKIAPKFELGGAKRVATCSP